MRDARICQRALCRKTFIESSACVAQNQQARESREKEKEREVESAALRRLSLVAPAEVQKKCLQELYSGEAEVQAEKAIYRQRRRSYVMPGVLSREAREE